MKTFIACLLAAAVSAADFDDTDLKFINWMSQHGRIYKSLSEFVERKAVWLSKHNKIEAHMAKTERNFSMAHNKFSDWTQEEMQVMLGDKSTDESNAYCLPPPSNHELPTTVPDSVNWVTAGMTTPVKDQGSCGSCWTFATMETVESANAIAGQGLPVLAEQQLVDCVTADDGCGGGMTYDAYTYLMTAYAYNEDSWPYTATDGTCTYSEADASSVILDTYVCVEPQSPEGMKPAVALKPVAISIDAGSDVFHNYSGGVLDSDECGISTNHAVAIVGYGTDEASGLEYWLVRNSWGTSWGEDGFIKIAITEGDGICAINHRPLYPIIKV